MQNDASQILQAADNEWVTFQGGELQGRRPRALCPACRERLSRLRERRLPVCFQCYRADLEREKSLHAAARLDTASEARFQVTLPFEPVNHQRLEALRTVRATERATMHEGIGRFAERRRRAQIEARHLLRMIEAGLHNEKSSTGRAPILAAAAHVAELQLPESWLPFVVAR
jgi:hypothetical protein